MNRNNGSNPIPLVFMLVMIYAGIRHLVETDQFWPILWNIIKWGMIAYAAFLIFFLATVIVYMKRSPVRD